MVTATLKELRKIYEDRGIDPQEDGFFLKFERYIEDYGEELKASRDGRNGRHNVTYDCMVIVHAVMRELGHEFSKEYGELITNLSPINKN